MLTNNRRIDPVEFENTMLMHLHGDDMDRLREEYNQIVRERTEDVYKRQLLYLQEFQSMEHFKQELIEYLDYYNNRRIKAKLKGLPPAIHRQQALSAARCV